MPLDPLARATINWFRSTGLPPLETRTIEEIRAVMDAPRVGGLKTKVARVADHRVPGPTGDLPARAYYPAVTDHFPTLVFFHPGGFVSGSIEGSDDTVRLLVSRSGCAVISVGYHRAPERRFPTQPEECYAATSWVSENATALDVDPDRLAVGGVSAGANLAAAVALLARDRGGPRLAFQLLFHPVLDYAKETPSHRENADGYFLTHGALVYFDEQYLPDPSAGADPRFSVLRAPSLAGLPPALVVTAEYDPLRDEGEAYAARLRESGVPAESVRYPGAIHAQLSLAALPPGMEQPLDLAARRLRETLGGTHPTMESPG
jgi:acetyl esterase